MGRRPKNVPNRGLYKKSETINSRSLSNEIQRERDSVSPFKSIGLWSFMCYTLVFIVVIQGAAAQLGSHIILKPSKTGDKDVALLIVPETNLENTAYEELASVLQSMSAIPLWVCVLDTKTAGDGGLALPVMYGLEQMTLKGMDADTADIFIAGHGRGGDHVVSYVSEVPTLFRGAILMGTFLKTKHKASSFPVPVMTLSGDLDGISRITRLAEAFRLLADDANFDPHLITQSPLVILEGFNHGVFSSGELPGPMQALDIDSEGTLREGQRWVANSTALFIAHTLETMPVFTEIAKIQFTKAFESALTITKPILDIKDMTENTQGESYFVRVAQKWLSGLQGDQSTRLTVESYIVGDATEIPPSVLSEGEQSVVVTFSDILRPDSKGEEDPAAPIEIAARMLSAERINQVLKNTTIVKSYTCKDLNYGSYLTAYHMVSEKTRRRFDNRHRGVIFHTDMLVQSDIAWKLSQLLVNTKDHELHVTAISYLTPNIEQLGERAGLYYCKILPPDRVMEWIYVESLRRSMNT